MDSHSKKHTSNYKWLVVSVLGVALSGLLFGACALSTKQQCTKIITAIAGLLLRTETGTNAAPNKLKKDTMSQRTIHLKKATFKNSSSAYGATSPKRLNISTVENMGKKRKDRTTMPVYSTVALAIKKSINQLKESRRGLQLFSKSYGRTASARSGNLTSKLLLTQQGISLKNSTDKWARPNICAATRTASAIGYYRPM